jgi:hypothetical protein
MLHRTARDRGVQSLMQNHQAGLSRALGPRAPEYALTHGADRSLRSCRPGMGSWNRTLKAYDVGTETN